MKDHEIVLRRDKKLSDMKKAINRFKPENNNGPKREDPSAGLFHLLLNYERKSGRGDNLCSKAR